MWKGLQDFLKDDPSLTEKITYEQFMENNLQNIKEDETNGIDSKVYRQAEEHDAEDGEPVRSRKKGCEREERGEEK